MSQTADELKKRTMRFALDVCALIRDLPAFEPGPTAQHQLARAATGVAFNYRATCRARSHTEFTARMGVVAEEADENAELLSSATLSRLTGEATELAAIMSAAYGTARHNERQKKRRRP